MRRMGSAVSAFVAADEPADELPMLDPVLLREDTEYGWRGLTGRGDVMEVKSFPGEPRALAPSDTVVVVDSRGVLTGRRAMPVGPCDGDAITAYIACYDLAIRLFKENRFADAVAKMDMAIALAPTSRARFNRALMLLSLGDRKSWLAGARELELRLDLLMPPRCAEVESAGVPRWRGEDIRGKNLLLVHDAGYGDTIMMLRYVYRLLDLGADVRFYGPPELARFVGQKVAVTDSPSGADCYCPMLSLLHCLRVEPIDLWSEPYLLPSPDAMQHWRTVLGTSTVGRKKIGIAWSVGSNPVGDYPRAIPLTLLVRRLQQVYGKDVSLYSVQKQSDGVAEMLGVNTITFGDFEDAAAFMTSMDEIVTVDTAAVHVAGSIGHPRITLLLPWWSSWRWRSDYPLYPNMRVCQQDAPGDWASALAKVNLTSAMR